jgi:hypothetical protein
LKSSTIRKYNLNITSKKIKVIALAGVEPIRAKITVDGKIIEQVITFRYLGCKVSYRNNKDVRGNFIGSISFVVL